MLSSRLLQSVLSKPHSFLCLKRYRIIEMIPYHTSNATQNYVFLPVDVRVRITLYSIIGFVGLYAIVANAGILYLQSKQSRKNRRNRSRRAFDRCHVTNIYVNSLATSHIICVAVSVPLEIYVNFVDIIDTDVKCKEIHFCNIVFIVVSINNLFVIGVERYLAIFHPFRVPSTRVVKILVGVSWVLGFLTSIIPSLTYRLQRLNVNQESFTLECSYDKTDPTYKLMQVSFIGFVFVIPGIVLSFTNTRILLYLKRKVKKSSQRTLSWRFYGTGTFLAVIFAHVLPSLFVAFLGIVTNVLKVELSITVDYIMRKAIRVVIYSNAAVSPTILFFSMPGLRNRFRSFISTRNNAVDINNAYQLGNINLGLV